MDSDSIKDLKQFITSEISGQLKTQSLEIKSEIKNDIKHLESNLTRRIDDLEIKLDTSLNHIGIQLTDTGSQLSNHEKRIFKLEHRSIASTQEQWGKHRCYTIFMSDMTFSEVSERIKKHLEERDWQKNSTRSLVISIVLEASELLEHYQWAEEPAGSKEDLASEIADILIYTFQVAQNNNIDIAKAMIDKLGVAAKKYPAKDFKGKSPAERQEAWLENKLKHHKAGLWKSSH